jgi:dihydroorotate dehydrogenase electron transfer subunit
MLMKLAAPEIAACAQPGQFVMLEVADRPPPLLRRPFSIHDIWFDSDRAAGILLLYQIVGQGTGLMSAMPRGSKIRLTGPHGRGYWLCETPRAILVAGGVGIAPLRFLGRELARIECETLLVIGARSCRYLHTDGFEECSDIISATDDGSKGIVGPATGALEAVLDQDNEGVTLYASGPTAMLRRVINLANLYEVDCQVSVERVMACGIGACSGCVLKALDEDGEPAYVRACKEGPVFNSRRIISF